MISLSNFFRQAPCSLFILTWFALLMFIYIIKNMQDLKVKLMC